MTTEAKYNRYSISVKDFERAIAFLQEAGKYSSGTLVHEALSFAAIVCYFRPFSPNEKDPNAAATSQLTLSEFQPLSSDEQAVHDKCKELRNKALAHAEFKYYPTRFDPTTGVTASALFSLTRYAPDLNQLAALAQKLALQCHNKRADYVFANRTL